MGEEFEVKALAIDGGWGRAKGLDIKLFHKQVGNKKDNGEPVYGRVWSQGP